MARGLFSFVLHAHLPFVRHPEKTMAAEERWLFEAMNESYIPLLLILARVKSRKWPVRFALSLSPSLVEMLNDTLIRSRYLEHMRALIKLAEKELKRNASSPQFYGLAGMHLSRFREAVQFFEDCDRDLVSAFAAFDKSGQIELFTTSATHGYSPLLRYQDKTVKCQVALGQETFTGWKGKASKGFWLPECGYYPGVESVVADAGFDWTILESHGLMNASERPRQKTFAPIRCANGLAVFARDTEMAEIVWSAESGYPGDPSYREFYRDIGFDLEPDYLESYWHQEGTPSFTGIKYHRITGAELEDKEPYIPEKAYKRVKEHARDFVQRITARFEAAPMDEGRPPLVLSPFDAELFGHWWFEGPEFLEAVFQLCSEDLKDQIEMLTPSDYLERFGSGLQEVQPAASSWGWKGYNECWISNANDWVWPLLHQAARKMERLAGKFRDVSTDSQVERVLNQALRCLLLAQSSDWTFIIQTRTSVSYAEARIRNSLARFDFLAEMVEKGVFDEQAITQLEELDRVFPDIDFRYYA